MNTDSSVVGSFFSFSSLLTTFCVLLLPSHRNNQGRFYCGVKKKSCLLTLPSAENKKRRWCVLLCFFCVAEFVFCCCCSLAVTYLKRFKDIMGCNLQIGLSPSASPSLLGLGRPRTTGTIVVPPINLLDEFKFHMSIK